MTKLKFDALSSGSVSFKLVPKKRIIKHDGNKKLTPKLVKGVCIKEGDDFKIQLDVRALKPTLIEKSQPDLLVLDFTEESYNLRGVASVFDRNPDEEGRYIRYIRSESQCKFFPGNKEKLVPFCKGWICSGYIIRRNGKLMFDFNECISPNGYETIKYEEDE